MGKRKQLEPLDLGPVDPTLTGERISCHKPSMRSSRRLTLLILLASGCDGGTANTAMTPESELVARLLPGYEDRIRVEVVPTAGSLDAFELETVDGMLVIRGSSGVAVASGLNHYLKEYANGHLSWLGDRIDLGASLPAVDGVVRKTSPHVNRYVYNFTVAGYTAPHWDWQRWERELDLIAAQGFNLALVTVGNEKVMVRALEQLGYNSSEIRAWIVGPAYQPWQWMGNIEGDGPAWSEELIERRAELGRQISTRMRELGITPVVPGFYGVVPPGFVERNGEDFDVRESGLWNGSFRRPDLLNPADGDRFLEVADAFYGAIEEVYGEITHFAADLFHEQDQIPDIDVTLAATNVQRAMLQAHPDAVWVIQGWFSNPRAELLDGLDPDHALLLDLWGDESPLYPTYISSDLEPFRGVPWVWSILQNFGGRTGLHGNLDTAGGLYEPESGIFRDPRRGALSGLGVLMEATHQNPVVLDLMSELIWRDPEEGAPDLFEWIQRYADRRYGGGSEDAQRAWTGLLETAYSTTPLIQFGTHESILCARPDLNAKNVFVTGPPGPPHYDTGRLEEALGDLLQARMLFGAEETYRYDLVDLTRQVLANRARVLLDEIREAFEANDLDGFVAASRRFLELILDQDRLVGTQPELLLGAWIQDARNMAADGEEADRLEGEARRLLTSWSEDESVLRDYAHREWAGLLGDYYHGRWKLYFDYLEAELDGGSAEPPDFFAYESTWTRKTDPDATVYRAEPIGDSVAVAEELFEKYAGTPSQQ